MKMKLYGVQKLDFTTKEGNRISGTNLFVAYSDPNVQGVKTDKVFINTSISLPNALKAGMEIEIMFDMKGKPISVSIVEKQ